MKIRTHLIAFWTYFNKPHKLVITVSPQSQCMGKKTKHFKNTSSYFSKPHNPVVPVDMPDREKDKNTIFSSISSLFQQT